MDAHTRQQAWELLTRNLTVADEYGWAAARRLRDSSRALQDSAYYKAREACAAANRALDLLDQLRGE